MKKFITLMFLSAALLPASAKADLLVNVGLNPTAGEGPVGTDSNYVAYSSAHESADSGAQVIYNGVTFAEGNLTGTFDVGVEFSWPDATAVTSPQSYSDRNSGGTTYNNFFASWLGTDTRTANGGIGGDDRLVLSLTGLAANQDFLFTSYHFDPDNQQTTFAVDQTATSGESSFAFARANDDNTLTPATDNAYEFAVTSDAAGNVNITYTTNPTFFGVNGFDLVAVPSNVPEPSSVALLGLVGFAGVLRRRRK